MGRQSFRLRRDTNVFGEAVGVGSYPRGGTIYQTAGGVLPANLDDDKSIRSTDFVTAFTNNIDSYFEAVAVAYDTTKLSWQLSDIPVDVASVTGSNLVGIKVVYSYTGYPEAPNDGITVFDAEANDDLLTNLASQEIFHTGIDAQGRWVYYSLFGHYYQSTGGTGSFWYEKLSFVEVLIPTNYESTEKLWNRIPRYYREQDTSGQLKAFIDIFGFEVDRNRSLIESVMTGSDPTLAEAEGVEQLAKLVGLEVNVDDIGVTRTRSLLHDIGYLRRQKGTYSGIVGYLKALSGSDVDFELVTGNYRATIYAQRANLIADPRFVFATSYGVTAQTGSVTTTAIDQGITIATGATGTKVALISKIGIPIKTDTNYHMSFNWGEVGGVSTIYNGYISDTPTWSTWTGLTSQNEIEVSGLDYIDPSNDINRRVFDMGAATVTGTTKYPVLVIDIPANTTVTIKRWMVEPNNFGPYFDGNSDFGGFLYQSNFSDYQWSNPSGKNVSYSIATVQRSRTIKVIKKVCPSIMPVNITFNPESTDNLRFDWVPGKT